VRDARGTFIVFFFLYYGPRARRHSRDRSNGCRDIANFHFPIWRPSAMLNFGNMQILTFCTVFSQNLHDRAKFRRDRLNGCGNNPNFRFPIWRPSAILHFLNILILTFRHCLRPQFAYSCKISSCSDER